MDGHGFDELDETVLSGDRAIGGAGARREKFEVFAIHDEVAKSWADLDQKLVRVRGVHQLYANPGQHLINDDASALTQQPATGTSGAEGAAERARPR